MKIDLIPNDYRIYNRKVHGAYRQVKNFFLEYTREQKEAFLLDVLGLSKNDCKTLTIEQIDEYIAENRKTFDEYNGEKGELPEL